MGTQLLCYFAEADLRIIQDHGRDIWPETTPQELQKMTCSFLQLYRVLSLEAKRESACRLVKLSCIQQFFFEMA